MTYKGWYDLTPPETLLAITQLDRRSFTGHSPISPDLVQSRLNAIRGSVPPEFWLTAHQHLNKLKARPQRKRHS